MNKRKVPKIRFKGFYDDWEQRKLIDLLDRPITDGPHETPNIVDDGIPFISADAIVDNKIDFTRKRGNITEEYDLQCCKKYKPEFHDVYLVKSGSTVGKVAIVETTQRFNIWSPLAAMRCKENSDPYFLFALLQTKENQAQVKDKASNGTQPNLSMRALEQFDIVSPYSRNEQIKIGEFFNNLDRFITLHQRKLEKLKIIKKSMLENCFPKNGEKVPKIRFSGFSDDWEQRKLNEITDVRDGTHDSPKYVQEGHPFITSKNVSNGFINYDDVQYVTDEDYEKINKRSKVDIHDILMGMIGTIGNLALIRRNPDFAIKNVALIKHTGDIDYQYLYQVLQADCMTSQLSTGMDGGTQKFVSLKKIRELDIPFPEELEQQKIGTYFSILDHLITLHQSKLEKLKMIKKSMLETMFV